LWTKDGNSGKYYHGGVKKTVIEGHWLFDGKRVTGDEACEQIDSLIPTLTFLASREGGWTRLFRDPDRTVFWELTYPQSEMHGGGPPRLESYSIEEVRAHYPDLGVD
jgi:hypothetical protein